MTNAEKKLLIRICRSSINKRAAEDKINFHFLVVSKSTINKYWKIFGAKDFMKSENEWLNWDYLLFWLKFTESGFTILYKVT